MAQAPQHIQQASQSRREEIAGRLRTAVERFQGEVLPRFEELRRAKNDYLEAEVRPLVEEIRELLVEDPVGQFGFGDVKLKRVERPKASYETNRPAEKLEIIRSLWPELVREQAPDVRGLTKNIAELAKQAQMDGREYVPPPGISLRQQVLVEQSGLGSLPREVRQIFNPSGDE